MADDNRPVFGGAYEEIHFYDEGFPNVEEEQVVAPPPPPLPEGFNQWDLENVYFFGDQLNEEVEEVAECINEHEIEAPNVVERSIFDVIQKKINLLVEHPVKSNRRLATLSGLLGYWDAAKLARSMDLEAPKKIYYATKNAEEIDQVVDLLNEMAITNLKVAVLIESSMRTKTRWGETVCSRFYFHKNELHERFLFKFREILEIVDAAAFDEGITLFGAEKTYDMAELIIIPQQLLISPVSQRDYNINLNNTILVFGEGYDMENLCCNEASITLVPKEIEQIVRELRQLVEALPPQERSLQAVLIPAISLPLTSFSTWIRAAAPNTTRVEILEALQAMRMEESMYENFEGVLNRALAVSTNPYVDQAAINKLIKILSVFRIFFGNNQNNIRDYHLEVIAASAATPTPTLKMICTSPAVVFRSLAETTWSTLITSSCLAPISTFKSGLGVTFDEVLQMNAHEAPRDRYVLAFCSNGPEEVELNLSYESRSSPVVQDAVGKSLIQICETIPNGVIAIFHTKFLLEPLRDRWIAPDAVDPERSIMNRLREVKNVFSELDIGEGQDPNAKFEEYRAASKTENGGLLLALARGKLYDKIHTLKGEEARAIVHVSVPYAAWYNEDLIVAKRRLIADRVPDPPAAREMNLDWYNKEAYRLMNLSFGLCVQDQQDWGALIVLDSRVIGKQDQFDELMPAWVRNEFNHHENFPGMIGSLQNLVRTCGGNN